MEYGSEASRIKNKIILKIKSNTDNNYLQDLHTDNNYLQDLIHIQYMSIYNLLIRPDYRIYNVSTYCVDFHFIRNKFTFSCHLPFSPLPMLFK